MKKICYLLRSPQFTSPVNLQSYDFESAYLNTITEIDPKTLSSSVSQLVVSVENTSDAQELLKDNKIKALNIPTHVLIPREDHELVTLCQKYDLFNVFMMTKDLILLKALVEYYFKNYRAIVEFNTQRLLDNLDLRSLTKKELQILRTIASSPRAEVAREVVLKLIWGPESRNSTNKLDVHICNLRKKLENQEFMIYSSEKGKISLIPRS